MNRAARTAIAGFSPALVVLACSSSTSTPMSPNDGGTGADATVSTEGGSGTDGASSAPLDGASTDATSVSSDGGPACGQFAGDTANLTCSADGNSLGECLADGGLDLQQCPNGCLREPAGQDSICMGTTNTWSCTGEWGTTPASNGNYYLTEFGCWVDDAGVHTDPDDNCIPACLAQAQAAGLCASTDTGPQCEERVTWYTADAGRFGCLQRLRVTNPSTGATAIAVALDFGPACSGEATVQFPVLDASGAVDDYLYGGPEGSSDMALVHVVEVDDSTPLGPVP
ncbi:MAG: hypothetical protein ACLQVI_21645 [Polyangiaceae bacterium]